MRSGTTLVTAFALWTASLLAPLFHVHPATVHGQEQAARHEHRAQHGTEVHAHFPSEQVTSHDNESRDSWFQTQDSHDAKLLNAFVFGKTKPPVLALPTGNAPAFQIQSEAAFAEFRGDSLPARDPPALRGSPPRAPPA